MVSSQSTQPRRPSPGFSSLCALRASAFSSPDVSSFNFKLSAACPERSRRVNSSSLSPFFATLTSPLQTPENTATLSPAFATLTRRVNHNPFVCHSYGKHPGWVSHLSNERVRSLPGTFRQRDSEMRMGRMNPSQAQSFVPLTPVSTVRLHFTSGGLRSPQPPRRH
jgi:hypothetical protein